jgi:hypothetical protein
MTLYECHSAMLRDRKRDVFQNGSKKIAAHDRALLERVAVHDGAAKIGEAAIGDDDEVGKKRLLVLCAGPARAHAQHPARQGALDQVCHRCLEHVDARRGLGACAEVLDEATVVEGAAFGAARVWDVYGLSGVEDCVTVDGDRVDAFEARAEAERAQRGDATRLEELADDAVWLCEGPLEEGDAEG